MTRDNLTIRRSLAEQLLVAEPSNMDESPVSPNIVGGTPTISAKFMPNSMFGSKLVQKPAIFEIVTQHKKRCLWINSIHDWTLVSPS